MDGCDRALIGQHGSLALHLPPVHCGTTEGKDAAQVVYQLGTTLVPQAADDGVKSLVSHCDVNLMTHTHKIMLYRVLYLFLFHF